MIKTLQTVDNEFLTDHVIGGNAVFPTVCAVAWMADAAELLYSGYQYQGFENYKLFKGIVFDGNEATDYAIDFDLLNENDGITLSSRISSLNAKGKIVYHYSAELKLKGKNQQVSVNKAALSVDVLGREIKNTEQAKALYSNGALFHGESLRGIKEVIRCDNEGLLLACQVPSIATLKAGDFPLSKQNIFANDLVYQAMLVWVRSELSMGSLPSSTQAWTVYQQVDIDQLFYLELKVVEQTSSKLIANISLISEDNTLLADITEAEVTVSESLNDLFISSSESSSTFKASGQA